MESFSFFFYGAFNFCRRSSDTTFYAGHFDEEARVKKSVSVTVLVMMLLTLSCKFDDSQSLRSKSEKNGGPQFEAVAGLPTTLPKNTANQCKEMASVALCLSRRQLPDQQCIPPRSVDEAVNAIVDGIKNATKEEACKGLQLCSHYTVPGYRDPVSVTDPIITQKMISAVGRIYDEICNSIPPPQPSSAPEPPPVYCDIKSVGDHLPPDTCIDISGSIFLDSTCSGHWAPPPPPSRTGHAILLCRNPSPAGNLFVFDPNCRNSDGSITRPDPTLNDGGISYRCPSTCYALNKIRCGSTDRIGNTLKADQEQNVVAPK